MDEKLAVDLKVLIANTHVGLAISPGFAAQVHLLQPDVMLLSEVVLNSPEEMHHLFDKRYLVCPGPDFREGRESSQTPVLLLRDRFKLLSEANPQVSPWRGGGEHGRLWPTRFGTAARALDRETGRIVNARSVHTWAVFPHAPDDVWAGHEHQVDHVADWAKRKKLDHVVIAGGDWNENLDGGPTYATRAMTGAGMRRAGAGMQPQSAGTSLHGPSFLDDVFLKGDGVRVVGHSIKRNAGPGADHKMVLVTLSVQPKR